MRRILIGYDGSSHGDDALALGQLLASSGEGAELTVAAVYKAVINKDSSGTESDYQERLRNEAEHELNRARSHAPQLPESAFRAVRAGSAAAGLHRLAEELEADVIVVGTSHRNALGRVWAGSATEQVLHGAPTAVAVAPVDYAQRPAADRALRRVGVAYDGSPEAKAALERAVALAEPAGARVVPVSVVDLRTPTTIGYGYEQYVDAVRDLAALELKEAGAAVRASGDVESIKREGDPATELAHVSGDVDLLVTGSRGYGPLKRVLLGSVTTRLVREAEGPLLLLPRSAVEPEE
ncbi:universal stress protein [Conexibacter sp. JD483]|uniref:universal stress protein n=1 Tax=unclassified Conexibacter TaxID=2627773 RepID=UPI002716570C|nr:MULTISPECIES: universal stress protein [unclassified Conexibacter]MDO8188979.1 universal stress protein [Conexibacter sp. CPCC 205706]MDO8201809.1 universal stress protein [Conexibacter sp. CPCC 205762]MDR9371502.1 universal stress protein [Conexibacter sp. JD483]